MSERTDATELDLDAIRARLDAALLALARRIREWLSPYDLQDWEDET